MKICIFGAGAIGGYLAARLAATNVDLSLVARGAHLEAMRRDGLTLRADAEETIVAVNATDDPAILGPQDYVVVTLKAHSVPAIVERLRPLLGPSTAVVTASNGLPWWYFHRLEGPHAERRLKSVDPEDVQWNGIGPERAIGCVVYPACEIEGPGVVRHIEGNRLILGEPSGEKSERVTALSAVFIDAGLRAPIRRIRDEIWMKLWGNLCFNPISALTTAPLDVIATDSPGTREVAAGMMQEAQTIGERLGVRFGVDIDKRIAGAAAVGAHRTSMLQDLEFGRPMEIDALLSAVREMGEITGVATPTIDVVLALVKQRARMAGCYT